MRDGARRFAYRLALRLGWADVDAMLASMSAAQFVEWRAYASLEPFDEERADLRAAIVAATIANVHRDPKRHPTPVGVDVFMPRFDRRPSQTWQQQKALAQMISAAYNADIEADHGR